MGEPRQLDLEDDKHEEWTYTEALLAGAYTHHSVDPALALAADSLTGPPRPEFARSLQDPKWPTSPA